MVSRPLHFIQCLSSLRTLIKRFLASYLIYADCITVHLQYGPGTFFANLVNHKKIFASVLNFLTAVILKVNSSKFQRRFITNQRTCVPESITIDGTRIETKDRVKVLGVNLDYKLGLLSSTAPLQSPTVTSEGKLPVENFSHALSKRYWISISLPLESTISTCTYMVLCTEEGNLIGWNMSNGNWSEGLGSKTSNLWLMKHDFRYKGGKTLTVFEMSIRLVSDFSKDSNTGFNRWILISGMQKNYCLPSGQHCETIAKNSA